MNYLDSLDSYYRKISELLFAVEMTNVHGKQTCLTEVLGAIKYGSDSDGKLFFIGNGASASMASHFALDFTKALGIPSFTFNDAASLTAYSNDYGWINMFSRPLKGLASKHDTLFAISSSGNSQNIVEAVNYADCIGMNSITFSGMNPENELRKRGDFNFYVPHDKYGPMEIIHNALLHIILDMYQKEYYG